MRRAVAFALMLLLLLVPAAPAFAAPPATIEKVPPTPCSSISLPPLTVSVAGACTYSGQIVWLPKELQGVWPHQQMENSRFEFAGQGLLTITSGSYPIAMIQATQPVTGRMMVHIHQPLPNDTGELSLPDGSAIPVGMPTTPYVVSIVLDAPVLVTSALGSGYYSMIQVVKGRVLFVR